MAKKMTKNEKYDLLLAIPAVAENDLLVEFIEHEKELLAKKNSGGSGEKKPSARTAENASVKDKIVAFMDEGERYSVSDLVNNIPDLPNDMTNNRMSALLGQLVTAGIIDRVKDKKSTFFTLHIEAETED